MAHYSEMQYHVAGHNKLFCSYRSADLIANIHEIHQLVELALNDCREGSLMSAL